MCCWYLGISNIIRREWAPECVQPVSYLSGALGESRAMSLGPSGSLQELAGVTGSAQHSGYCWSPTGIFYDSSPHPALPGAFRLLWDCPHLLHILGPIVCWDGETCAWESDPLLQVPSVWGRQTEASGLWTVVHEGPGLRGSHLPWLHLGNCQLSL